MNDSNTSATTAPTGTAVTVQSQIHGAIARWRSPAALLALGGALLIVLLMYASHSDLSRRAVHLSEALTATQNELTQARDQLGVMNETLDHLKGERADLEQLTVDLRRGREETLLIEVERLVSAAAGELQLSGNVAAALNALHAADTRLARTQGATRAPVLALRKTLARDIERLRALPIVDVTGIALQLDEVAMGIEAWPMLADPMAALAGKEVHPRAPVAVPQAAPKSGALDEDFWTAMRRWFSEEFGDLVRIREVQTPESVLLTSTQQQLVRHQLRLRLFDARQALIARNDRLYRSDLQEARALLQRYFDVKKAAPAAALVLIDKLAGATLSVEIPNAALTETLTAVQNALAAAQGAARP